jgi:hypothetical protein
VTDLRGLGMDATDDAPGGFLEAYAGVFQVAYVTHDRAAAERELGARLGLIGWTDLDVDVGGAELAVAFARAGRIQVELIQPIAGETEIFTDLLPAHGLVKLHHLGVRVEDIELAVGHAAAAGYVCRRRGEIEGQLRFAFVDTTPDLGHYTELAQFTADGWKFVSAILAVRA